MEEVCMRLLLIIGIVWRVLCVVVVYSACIMAGHADDVRGDE
jgi:tryptophan-rich sensory protein